MFINTFNIKEIYVHAYTHINYSNIVEHSSYIHTHTHTHTQTHTTRDLQTPMTFENRRFYDVFCDVQNKFYLKKLPRVNQIIINESDGENSHD